MAIKQSSGSKRIFQGLYHYETAPWHQKRTSGIHQGTDYGTSGVALAQYPPLDGGIVKQVVNKETNGDARGCRVRIEYPKLNFGLILQHLVNGSVSVKVGDTVNKDTKLGLTGMTGKYKNGQRVSTGVHAHAEVYDISQSPNAPSNLVTFDFALMDFEDLEAKYYKDIVVVEDMEAKGDPFKDVDPDAPASDWANVAVSWALKDEIIFGDDKGRLLLKNGVTREAFISFLYRYKCKYYISESQTKPVGMFDSTDVSQWALMAMMWAVSENIIYGDESGYLNPGSYITREEVVTILCRYVAQVAKVSVAYTNNPNYDYSYVSSWALDSMKWAVDKGIIFGKYNNELQPQGLVTREEALVFLNRLYEKFLI